MKNIHISAILTLFAILITLPISCTNRSAGTEGTTEQRTVTVIESTAPPSTEQTEDITKKDTSEPSETITETVETTETTETATDTEEIITETEETTSKPPKETIMTTEPIQNDVPETNYAADFSVSRVFSDDMVLQRGEHIRV